MMKPGSRIDEMYAWTVIDPKDDIEGTPAFDYFGTAMPMMGADIDRATSMRPIAQQVARESGVPVTLKRFTTVEVLETVYP